ncbi:endoplasmic reticulum aminopeptidase 1-like [Centroberyx affinis]|uniref:endoplasmic reticulum aminopeptidase 1-like n=1 Tax=Centroberyx affinis TaxID=166261 RepID=UPI003A5C150E
MLTSHPVSQPVSLPVRDSTQIRHTFDVVSHNKGAAVIFMLHSYLSDSVFMGGIRHYLSEHRYDSAKPDDLWRAMTETAQRSNMTIGVKSLMDTWITQTGYPVVTVTVQETHIHLQQNLFTISPQNDTGTVWQIPFTFYTSSSSAVISHLMKSKEEVIELPEDATWIKANVNSTGFYRVSYDSRTLRLLHSQLQGSQPALGPADRAGLVDDAFHLARQGSLKYCDAFTLSTFMMKEEEYLPITVFINHMMNMIIKFSFRGEHCITRLLKEHLWAMLGRQAGAQRWEDAGSLPAQIRRVKLLEVAVRTGRSPASEQEALRLFHFWMAKDGDYLLPSSLRGLIFQVAVMNGGHEEWTYLLQKYCHCSSSKEKVLMLTGLCHTKDQAKIQCSVSFSSGC